MWYTNKNKASGDARNAKNRIHTKQKEIRYVYPS